MWNKFGVTASLTPVKSSLSRTGIPGPFAATTTSAEGWKPSSVSPAPAKGKGGEEKDGPSKFFTDFVKKDVKKQVLEDFNEGGSGGDDDVVDRTPNMARIKLHGRSGVSEMAEVDTPDDRSLMLKLGRSWPHPPPLEADGGDGTPEKVGAAEAKRRENRTTLTEKYSAWDNYDFVHRTGAASPAKAWAQSKGWSCGHCTFFNEKELAWVCECCGSAKGRQSLGAAGKQGAGGNDGADDDTARVQNLHTSWNCKSCSFENEKPKAKRCAMCDTKRDTEELGFELQMEMEDGAGQAEGGGQDKKYKKKKKGLMKKLFSFFN